MSLALSPVKALSLFQKGKVGARASKRRILSTKTETVLRTKLSYKSSQRLTLRAWNRLKPFPKSTTTRISVTILTFSKNPNLSHTLEERTLRKKMMSTGSNMTPCSPTSKAIGAVTAATKKTYCSALYWATSRTAPMSMPLTRSALATPLTTKLRIKTRVKASLSKSQSTSR